MTIYTRHPQTGNEVGRWERSFGVRWWEGPCTCGSGEEGHELYDGNDIYCGITCSRCRREDKYRPEIINRSYDANDVDEPIEEEE
jgi:hypothetical protein